MEKEKRNASYPAFEALWRGKNPGRPAGPLAYLWRAACRCVACDGAETLARMTHDPPHSPIPEADFNAATVLPLLSSPGLLAATFAALPAACLLLTPELRIIAVSDAYLASSLTTRSQLVGHYLVEVFPGTPEGEAIAALRAALQQVLATGQPLQLPIRPYRISDPAMPGTTSERFWQLLYTPVFDEHHAAAGLVLTVVDVPAPAGPRESQRRELTASAEADQQPAHLLRPLDQVPVAIGSIPGPDLPEKKASFRSEEILAKNAELERARQQLQQLNEELEARVLARTQALRQAQAATEQEREQLYQVFEQTPVAIAIMRGPNLRVELANPAVAAIWGREPAQVLGRPYFEAVPDTAGQGFEQILSDVLTTSQPFTITEAPVTLARAHTGLPTQAYVNFVFQPLHDAAGATVGLIASGTEVTEQVQARQRVQELNAKLQASNEQLSAINQQLTRTNNDLDTFVYTASHDLKVPIANIEGLLDALGRELHEAHIGETIPHLMRMMQEAVARFQQTIGHLTDIARLQQESSLEHERTSLPAIVADVQLDLAPLLQATAAQLTTDLADVPELPLSTKNLRSVVYNLLSNALKYRAPGRRPTVHIRCRRQGDAAVLTVQDNGLGLDERQQQRLFKLFQRLHTHVEGSGVGLYMVKKMVENVGGTVRVQSTAGVGSTFIVTLPLPPERSVPARA